MHVDRPIGFAIFMHLGAAAAGWSGALECGALERGRIGWMARLPDILTCSNLGRGAAGGALPLYLAVPAASICGITILLVADVPPGPPARPGPPASPSRPAGVYLTTP